MAAAFTNRIDEFAQGVIDLKEDRGKVERERQIISEYLEKIENLDQNLGKRVYGGEDLCLNNLSTILRIGL